MAKTLAKYFIALVPEGDIQEEATWLKLLMKDKFNLKYALKSPAHVTIKMPFSWNEHKEDKLMDKLSQFFNPFPSFDLDFKGIDKFGRRVLFIKVYAPNALMLMQEALKKFSRTDLHLVEELSDKAFHPHMTIAFKDTKPARFEEYWEFLQTQKFKKNYQVKDVALLKKAEGRWVVIQRFPLRKEDV